MPTGCHTSKVTKSPSGILRILYLMFLQMTLSQFGYAGPISPFLFFRVQYFQNAFWKYCSRKNSQCLSRASAPARSRWPNFTFFIFPGTVLPFFYFSVVRKVPEKPVLFLPHPRNCVALKQAFLVLVILSTCHFIN